MGNLGERLRQEREARGISLQTIAAETRIGARLLEAIEEEAFDQLPGGIFNKSFIQQYARYLGLDEEQAVRDYLRSVSPPKDDSASVPTTERRSLQHSRSLVPLALGVAAVGLIVVVLWLMFGVSQQPPASASAPHEPEAAASSELDEVLPNSDTEPSREEASAPAGTPGSSRIVSTENDPAASPAVLLRELPGHPPLAGELPEELLLEINARSTVWISITADGEKQWQGTLQANQTRQATASETIRLTVGNAAGVELTLNGKDLGALGGEGEVKTVTLAKRALQEEFP